MLEYIKGFICWFVFFSLATIFAGRVEIQIVDGDALQQYAAMRLKDAFIQQPTFLDMQVRFTLDDTMPPEAYRNEVSDDKNGSTVHIQGGDSRGILYGTMTLLEQLKSDPLPVESCEESARFPFRALKFNLPWMSYRSGEALSLHAETCRDLAFWKAFLDMMVENRFNALTLWSLHPFHLMIRNVQYPEACDLTEEELAEWQSFWRSLFAMAKERGIETYVVNWNVFVSPGFAKKHHVAEYSLDASSNYIGPGNRADIIKDYTRTTVTQLIDTYPNLTGLGISLGERMQDFSPFEREQWIQDTFVAGMKDAKRPVRFIHRLPFSKGSQDSGAPGLTTEQLTRQGIESLKLPTTVLTEAKFNWSHAHSTPKLMKIHGGQLGDTYWNPPPENYRIHWMVRNEDFFALRWAEPDFVRTHIQQNGSDYVGGYYLGSECYIPAKDYISASGYSPGYAFQRQWLYYMIWGRLLYNPKTPNERFVQACRDRYGQTGETLFNALRLGSRMPLRLATFYNFSWDFTLYSEGFMSITADSNPERLITVEELIKREPVDPNYLSIREYFKVLQSGKQVPKGSISPLQLADDLIEDGRQALNILKPIIQKTLSKPLQAEIADAHAWAYLSIYFGEKLKAATALYHYRDNKDQGQACIAVESLQKAVQAWEKLVKVTESVYLEMPLAHVHHYHGQEDDPRIFHWKRLLPVVNSELDRIKVEVNNNQVLIR